jgi:hypothetical protein
MSQSWLRFFMKGFGRSCGGLPVGESSDEDMFVTRCWTRMTDRIQAESGEHALLN